MTATRLEAAILAMQDGIIEASARVLGRLLTDDEVAIVRRERSLLFLESVDREFHDGRATRETVRELLDALAQRVPGTRRG